LALFSRRSTERVVRSSLPAAENLHRTGREQMQQTMCANARYSITSSARNRNGSGIVSPSAFAVVRLE
jgi:hypothetical protein